MLPEMTADFLLLLSFSGERVFAGGGGFLLLSPPSSLRSPEVEQISLLSSGERRFTGAGDPHHRATAPTQNDTAASPLSMFINGCLCFFTTLQKPHPNDSKAINFTWIALKNIFLFETPLICCVFVYFCSFYVDQTVKLC